MTSQDAIYTIQSGEKADAVFVPRGGVKDFIYCKDHETVVEGPAETGKTWGACWKIHTLATKYAGARIVMLRKVQKHVYDSVLETFRNITAGAPLKYYGGLKPDRIIYPNRSVIYIGGMDTASKVLSSERDIIYFNQVEEATLKDWEYLTTRATGRGAVMPYTQVLGDCNPGPPMHWIKKRAKQGYLTLIKTTHKDNPTLYDDAGNITAQGKTTLRILDKLTGSTKMRLRWGLWAAPEGAIYTMFSEDKNKCKSFPIPRTWPRVAGVDPLGAFTAVVWGAFDPDNKILNIYREYYEPFGLTTSGHVDKVLEISSDETIWQWFGGGPTERQSRTDWTGAGITLSEPLIKDVWAGIDRVNTLLKDVGLVIHENCIGLLSEIGDYRRLLKDGIPTDTIENKQNYHLLDALRYLVVGITGDGEQVEVNYDPVVIGKGW